MAATLLGATARLHLVRPAKLANIEYQYKHEVFNENSNSLFTQLLTNLVSMR
jgi:hypothetical protein